MNLMNRMISSDSNPKLNINGTVKGCECEECKSVILQNENTNISVEYPSLSEEEEIEQIISERYSYKDEKTKNFIRKALRIHGDRYDYSESIFINYKTEVKITCHEFLHDYFLQTPNKHIYGKHGCPICGGAKSNAQIFIYKSCLIGTNYLDYDYTKINYTNNTTEVMIFCKKCNKFFSQEPRLHLIGIGCPNCRENQPMTTERFIFEAKQIGTNSIDYNYDNSVYVNRDIKIEIYCNHCKKSFSQRYDAHLDGQGCPSCKINKTLDSRIEEFLQKSKKLFHNLYNYKYIKEDYINNDTEVRIICNSCGKTFKMRPRNHISGQGCSHCNMSKGEVKIMIFLESNNIKFIRQFKFNDCKYIKTLSFDFYIPKYNLCIEYDGEQHFKKNKME